jgi:hypothetical protein
MSLCKYKDIFGAPDQGVHKYKLFGLAVVDVVLTVLAAILLTRMIGVSLWITIPFLFLLGIIFHKLYCVNTALNRFLGVTS